jgi:hypothetical protein
MPRKTKSPEDESLLVSAAKKIGKAAGTVAAASGLAPTSNAESQQKKNKGRLAPKNKARLPRRQKKAQKKRARSAAL